VTAEPWTSPRTAGITSITVVDDGEDVLVGNPATGVFVAVPPVGGVVIRALQRGADPAEAAAEAERFVGEPVDVAEFLAGLAEAGVMPNDDEAASARPSARIQQRGWLAGPEPRLVQWLFGRVAWTGYAAAAVFSLACLIARPQLRPSPQDAFVLPDNAGLALLVWLPLSYLRAALHEAWHWLAARALGLTARFGVDRRLYFLVFETDLSQLWTVPRRQRYGPQLAGLAIDSVQLAALLALSLTGWLDPASLSGRVIAAWVLLLVFSMLWQCMLFLRTDLYGVLVTATGCRNLWEVKSLLLRRAFGRLDADGAAQLAAAHPRDLVVGRWFRWLYLAGLGIAAGYLAAVFVPVQLTLIGWAADELRAGPLQPRFWTTLVLCVVIYLPLALVAWLWLTGRRRRTPTP
jgi:putative peptide zinc metalloprotease protein